jgi:hypothetical protein
MSSQIMTAYMRKFIPTVPSLVWRTLVPVPKFENYRALPG